MGANRRRRRVEPTDDEWGRVELLCGWPEQREYEYIRPLVLFCGPAVERSSETGAASERTLQRRTGRFDAAGMESLTVEHAGEPLSRYEVKVEAATGALRSVGRPKLFGLDSLGEAGWLKVPKLGGCAPRAPRALQEALLPYAEAL